MLAPTYLAAVPRSPCSAQSQVPDTAGRDDRYRARRRVSDADERVVDPGTLVPASAMRNSSSRDPHTTSIPECMTTPNPQSSLPESRRSTRQAETSGVRRSPRCRATSGPVFGVRHHAHRRPLGNAGGIVKTRSRPNARDYAAHTWACSTCPDLADCLESECAGLNGGRVAEV